MPTCSRHQLTSRLTTSNLGIRLVIPVRTVLVLLTPTVDAKVSTPMDGSEYYFLNISGSRVKTEEEAAGHQIKHRLSHPQYVMFGYEVGTDTNQMEDGKNGGQRYIIVKGSRTNLLLSKASGRFTLMGVNYATGEHVLCI